MFLWLKSCRTFFWLKNVNYAAGNQIKWSRDWVRHRIMSNELSVLIFWWDEKQALLNYLSNVIAEGIKTSWRKMTFNMCWLCLGKSVCALFPTWVWYIHIFKCVLKFNIDTFHTCKITHLSANLVTKVWSYLGCMPLFWLKYFMHF